jgi:hypothetical protein
MPSYISRDSTGVRVVAAAGGVADNEAQRFAFIKVLRGCGPQGSQTNECQTNGQSERNVFFHDFRLLSLLPVFDSGVPIFFADPPATSLSKKLFPAL